MQLCMKNGSGKHPNGPSTCTHAQVLCYVGQMRWSWTFWNGEVKGNNFHVEHFFTWACIMMNFQLDVWEIKHIWKFSKSQVKCSLLPPWITFSMDFKWEAFFNESCSSFKPIQFSHKFDLNWILHEGVMHFRSSGISLVQWTWAKMTYNVSSWHMPLQVEFEIS